MTLYALSDAVCGARVSHDIFMKLADEVCESRRANSSFGIPCSANILNNRLELHETRFTAQDNAVRQGI